MLLVARLQCFLTWLVEPGVVGRAIQTPLPPRGVWGVQRWTRGQGRGRGVAGRVLQRDLRSGSEVIVVAVEAGAEARPF